MFQLQTLVTNSCNLDCAYCYIKQHSENLTLKNFSCAIEFLPHIKQILRKYNTDTQGTTIAFFGGEPLLNMRVIRNIVNKYKEDYVYMIQSNGYFVPKYEQELIKLNIGYGVSYDGPYLNNRTSKKLDSFPINELLETMKKRGVKAMISPSNVASLHQNFEYFISIGVYHPDFALVRDNIWNESSIKEFKHQLDLINLTIDTTFEKTGILPMPGIYTLYLLDSIMGNTMGKRPFTCFSGTHGVSIQNNGDIYPCARFSSNNKFKLGNYIKQELNEQLIAHLSDLVNPVYNKYCESCCIRRECNMGCNYSQLENGNFKESKPIGSICELYKICYDYACDFYVKYTPQIKPYLESRLSNCG
jgi:uncharacterized protein